MTKSGWKFHPIIAIVTVCREIADRDSRHQVIIRFGTTFYPNQMREVGI